MKIVYLSSSIIPSRAANSVHVMKMSQAFAKNGHDVTLFAPNRVAEEENNIKNIYSFYAVDEVFSLRKIFYPNIRYVRNFIYAFACLVNLFKEKPDLVYGRNLLACYLSAFFFTTSFEAHSPMESKLKIFILNRLVRKKKFKNLVVISDALKKLISKQLPKNTKANIVVAHDGADQVSLENNKVQLEGSNKNLNIGYIGHLYSGRGVELIFDCASKLSESNFHLVGGQDSDIRFWKEVCFKKNLSNVFFYGFVTPAKAEQFRNSFDVLIAPYAKKVSVFGGKGDTSEFMSPLKIFEYMAHRKAIVASDLPVLREVLSEKNAILCNPENAEKWVEALDNLRDKKLRDELATNAYNDFIENYTWLNRANRVL